jgi:hypothetical protein
MSLPPYQRVGRGVGRGGGGVKIFGCDELKNPEGLFLRLRKAGGSKKFLDAMSKKSYAITSFFYVFIPFFQIFVAWPVKIWEMKKGRVRRRKYIKFSGPLFLFFFLRRTLPFFISQILTGQATKI